MTHSKSMYLDTMPCVTQVAGLNLYRCRPFGWLALTDRSVGHGRYWWSVWFHLRDNTVDIDGQFSYTYGELRLILTVGLVHSTQKLVGINRVSRFIQKQNLSTVDIDRRSGHTLKKTQKKCWFLRRIAKTYPQPGQQRLHFSWAWGLTPWRWNSGCH